MGSRFAQIISIFIIALCPAIAFGATYDLNGTNTFDMKWNGGIISDSITSVGNGTPGFLIVNIDNNALANDLIIIAPSADVNGKAGAGAVYLVKDVGQNDGQLDLNNVNNYAVRWNGGIASDGLGIFGAASFQSGQAVFVVNADNNAYANDLVIGASGANTKSADTGAVYLIKDVDKKIGNFDMNVLTSFDVRWDGSVASDALGNSGSGGRGILITDVDNNGYDNDLLMGGASLDIVRGGNGGVYLVKDIDKKSGIQDLNNGANYAARWGGSVTNDSLTSISTRGGPGFEAIDIDNNGYLNDLLIIGNLADTSVVNSGAVYLVKDIDKKLGTYDFNTVTNYAARWGGSRTTDMLGATDDSGQGVRVVNIDNNAYANDFIFNIPNADALATDTGAAYLIKDVDKKIGIQDLNNTSNFDVRWSGSRASDKIGSSVASGDNVQLVNIDNNAYANDLLIGSYAASVFKSSTGVLHLIKDIDKKSGIQDLNISTNYDVRWFANANDYLTRANASTNAYDNSHSVQLVNVDNNAFANDLLVATSGYSNPAGGSAGAVFLIKDAHTKTGDINIVQTNDAMWHGGNITDQISETAASGNGVQLKDLDGNGYTNDLLIAGPQADVNASANNGVVYLIKDIDRKSGTYDLNIAGNYAARWNGGNPSDGLVDTDDSNSGMQVVNVDNGPRANDLLLTASNADVNGKINAGAVYLIKNIDTKSGDYDLNNTQNYDIRWSGGTASDKIGANASGLAVQLTNIDSNLYTNDLLIAGSAIDSNQVNSAGTIYIFRNISPIISDGNIMAFWRLDEGYGAISADLSPNLSDLNLFSSPTWISPGYSAQGIQFTSASSQYAKSYTMIDSSGFNAVSISLWAQVTSSPSTDTRLFESTTDFNTTNRGFAILMNHNPPCSNGSAFAVTLKGDAGHNISCFADPSSGWHHFVAIFDKNASGSNETKLYVDGVLQTAASQPVTNNNENNFGNAPFFLAAKNGASKFADVNIDQVRFYNKALTESDINQLYYCEPPTVTGVDWVIDGNTNCSLQTTVNATVKGLVGWWAFDEGFGTVTQDQSGSGNSGTIASATWVNGKFGKGLDFDGIDDNVSVGTTNLPTIDDGTISAWVKIPPSPSGTDMVLAYWSTASSSYGYYKLVLSDGNRPILYNLCSNGGDGICKSDSGITLTPDTWYHITGTFGGLDEFDSGAIYINAELKATGTFDSFYSVASPWALKIGSDVDATDQCKCTIDDVRIYNRKLSTTDINNLYKENYTTHLGGNIDIKNGTIEAPGSHKISIPTTKKILIRKTPTNTNKLWLRKGAQILSRKSTQ